jgi:hypothetical protein
MMSELHINNAQMGWVFAFFTWGYALFQLPDGLGVQIFGLHRTIAWCAVIWSVMTFLTGLLPGTLFRTSATIIGGLAGVRFLLGAFQAPLYPVTSGVIANWFPVSRWALPNAHGRTALTLGAGVTPLLVAPMLVPMAGAIASMHRCCRCCRRAVVVVRSGSAAGSTRVNQAEIDHQRRPGGAGQRWLRLWWRAGSLPRNRDTLLLSLAYMSDNRVFYISRTGFRRISGRATSITEGGMLDLPFMRARSRLRRRGLRSTQAHRAALGLSHSCRHRPGAGCRAAVAGAYAANPYMVAATALCRADGSPRAFWPARPISPVSTRPGCGVLNTGATGVISSLIGARFRRLGLAAGFLSGVEHAARRNAVLFIRRPPVP